MAGPAAAALAGLLALPIAWVAASVLQAAGDAWRHIAATLLGAYVANTALLVSLVACGVERPIDVRVVIERKDGSSE